jgi:hypothetical protein
VSKLIFNQAVVSNWKIIEKVFQIEKIKPVVSKLTFNQAGVCNWKIIETVFKIGKKSSQWFQN